MHCQAQFARFLGNGVKQVILHLGIFLFARRTSFDIAGKDGPGFVFLRIAEVQRAQVGRFKLDCHRPGFLLTLQRRRDYLLHVVVQYGRHCRHILIPHVALQQHFFALVEGFAVRGVLHGLVLQGE